MAGRRRLARAARREAGLEAARAPIAEQDAIWSRCSSDKVDTGQVLMGVLADLFRASSPRRTLRALSVGSSAEPQFRILQPACRGGLYLLDVDAHALAAVDERVARQHIEGVRTVEADYTQVLASRAAARRLRHDALDERRVSLVTFHHCLYYTPRPTWDALFDATWSELLERAPRPVAVHAVLMSHRSDLPTSTTAIYNAWAGRFFGAHNDQDLAGFGRSLRRSGTLPGATVRTHTSRVLFDADDFGDLMRCIWMILLHPHVHRFSEDQQVEVTEWVYANLWSRGVPLTQFQDHLVVTR